MRKEKIVANHNRVTAVLLTDELEGQVNVTKNENMTFVTTYEHQFPLGVTKNDFCLKDNTN